jgi:hypothetical protein
MENSRLPIPFDLEKRIYQGYLELLRKSDKNLLVECDKKREVLIGDVRIFNVDPSFYLLITKKLSEELFEVVPFTEYWILAKTSRIPPKIKIKKYSLTISPLPYKYYFLEELLFKYSCTLTRVNERVISKVLDYVEKAEYQGSSLWTLRFLKEERDRISLFSMASVLITLDKEEKKEFIIEMPEEVEEELALAYAATQEALKGENWLGVREGDILYLYLPMELLGKEIIVKYGEREVYRGPIETSPIKLKLKGKNYDLEGKLHVQLL